MKFSIIIPFYNSEKWVSKCIDSVLNQTYKNYELILIDDISTDNTYNEILKYKDKAKIIKNKSKRLTGGTRNVGILEATGDYIIFMDGDDWLKDNQVLEDINNKLNGEDVIYLGFDMLCADAIIESRVLEINSKEEALDNIFPAPWLRVAKRELYLETLFPEGTMFEDKIQNTYMSLKMKTFTNLGRTTHIWNRNNENSATFSPKWGTYRFEYCGELYRLLQEVEDEKDREYIINELKLYMNSCKDEVDKL